MTDKRKSGRSRYDGASHLDDDLCLDLLHGLLTPEDGERVFAHMSICPACEERVRTAYGERLRTEATAARDLARLDGQRVRAGRPRRAAGRDLRRICLGFAVALALLIVLIFGLPPRPSGEDRVRRGEDGPRILRPVPGEVIRDATPTLTWTPIAGADRYRIEIEAVDRTFGWTGESAEARLTLPRDARLPRGERFRVFLDPIPGYTGPPRGVSTTFSTGSAGRYLAYRLRSAPRATLVPALLSLLLLIAGIRAGLSLRDGD